MERPFDISKYILDEIFKETYPRSWPAGGFHYQLRLGEVDQEQLDIICEWLSINCKDNYIVSRETLEIVSGGTTNNRLSWVQKKTRRDKTYTIKIRLDVVDIMLFRMVWIS